MLYIGEGLELQYLEAKDKYKLDEIINSKRYRVADTPLTYRQANSLSNDKLLPDDRDSKEGWHKFSLKELTYILIVHELKQMGFKHAQLKQLWNSFFREYDPKGEIVQESKGLADIAIGIVFGHVEVILAIDSDGNTNFYDPLYYSLFSSDIKSHVRIQLNKIVNKLLTKAGKKTFPVKTTLYNVFDDKTYLTDKEHELLSIIRDKSYSAIKIRKKDGEIHLVHAERLPNGVKPTTKDLMKMIEEKDYQDVSIVKRDGKIVNYKVEETIKF